MRQRSDGRFQRYHHEVDAMQVAAQDMRVVLIGALQVKAGAEVLDAPRGFEPR